MQIYFHKCGVYILILLLVLRDKSAMVADCSLIYCLRPSEKRSLTAIHNGSSCHAELRDCSIGRISATPHEEKIVHVASTVVWRYLPTSGTSSTT